LRERQLQLEKVLLDIVPPEMWQKVGLKDGQWIERVAGSGCLRGYRNQFAHQSLRRGQAKKYLEWLINNWA